MEDALSGFIYSYLDQLRTFRTSGNFRIGGRGFLLLMVMSLASSFAFSALYLFFYRVRATGTQIHRAFPYVGVAVTALLVCIQYSLPLSLGLLGALSIVRFRTPIKEPEEIGFILLVIASSIAIATGNFRVLLVLLPIALVAALILRYGPRALKEPINEGFVSVTGPSERFEDIADDVQGILDRNIRFGRLHSINRSEAGTSVTYSFTRISESQLSTVRKALGAVPDITDFNVFLNRQAAL